MNDEVIKNVNAVESSNLETEELLTVKEIECINELSDEKQEKIANIIKFGVYGLVGIILVTLFAVNFTAILAAATPQLLAALGKFLLFMICTDINTTVAIKNIKALKDWKKLSKGEKAARIGFSVLHILGALCSGLISAQYIIQAFSLNKNLIGTIISAVFGLFGSQMFGKALTDTQDDIKENSRKIMMCEYLLDKLKVRQKVKTLKG